MSESFFWCHAFVWLPLKTLVYEINKICLRIICLHHVLELFAFYLSNFSFRIRSDYGPIVIIKKYFPATCTHQHRPRWYSFYFHDALHLLFLVLTSKDGETYIKFIENTTKRPHINCGRILNAKHYLWCAIESGLDVGVKLLILVGTASKVNYLYTRLVFLPE